jgi:3-oxosteroid 1-dehydrogenase
MNTSEAYDIVVVGSGGGGLCAALTAAAHGKRALVVEKRPTVGGSTAMSGGVLWVPNNPVAERAGLQDSFEDGMRYLNAVVGDAGPASSPERRRAFLQSGRATIEFLERQGLKLYFCDGYSDYYDERPGGKARGRVLAADMISSRDLGEWYPKLQQFEGWALPVNTDEFHDLTLVKRTWRGKVAALKIGMRAAREKLLRDRLLCRGAALQARMLLLTLARGVPIWLDSPVEELIYDGESVRGVRVRRGDGEGVEVRARDGVLIASGGFARNADMRRRYQPQPSSIRWTAANPGETGEMIEMAIELGAAMDMLDEAIWLPVSLMPEGTIGGFHNPHDLAKPHAIMVNSRGRRFVNEAASYMELGQAMYREHSVPCWAILESRHRARYPWGATPPGITPRSLISSGYMREADSIEALATQCGLEPKVLRQTVERFNAQARDGRDDDFQRGARAYDRYYADSTHGPNPSLGALEKGPFYAVQLFPGDVGTFGGILTDENASVLRRDGSPITGLYATGNCTASVMGRTYPAAGASIAASFVFGYVAALHSAGAASQPAAPRRKVADIA